MNTNQTTYPLFFLFILCLALGTNLSAQKRALGQPIVFDRPVQSKYHYLSSTKSKHKAPWIVICDREGAQTFEKISPSGELEWPKEQLTFRDWFYVSEETDCCIRIFKGTITSATLRVKEVSKDYGWINKENILLWTNSLVHAKTKIKLQALLFNRASDMEKMIRLDKKEQTIIYAGPYTKESIDEEVIHDIYYILKSTDDKYLLSINSSINPKYNSNDIIGWVRQGRVETMSNRLWLEPNFQEAAFTERKNNSNLQFAAYADAASAIRHLQTSKRTANEVVWTHDPVNSPSQYLAREQQRFGGHILRFPVLGGSGNNHPIFRSMVIGRLPDTNDDPLAVKVELGYPNTFSPSAATLIFNLAKEGNKRGVTPEILNTIVDGRYRFATEVFIPKKIEGASYPTYSLVLLMSEDELENYTKVLNQLAIVLMGTTDMVRKGLHTNLTNLAEQYTGHKLTRNYETGDLRAAMQGVHEEGFKMDKKKDFVINDVLNEKKMSDKEVRNFTEIMVLKAKNLKKILKAGKSYEFGYTSKNNTYYWIPIEYTF